MSSSDGESSHVGSEHDESHAKISVKEGLNDETKQTQGLAQDRDDHQQIDPVNRFQNDHENHQYHLDPPISFTSFSNDGFSDSTTDPNLLTNFYTKFKTAATTAMHLVIPTSGDMNPLKPHDQAELGVNTEGPSGDVLQLSPALASNTASASLLSPLSPRPLSIHSISQKEPQVQSDSKGLRLSTIPRQATPSITDVNIFSTDSPINQSNVNNLFDSPISSSLLSRDIASTTGSLDVVPPRNSSSSLINNHMSSNASLKTMYLYHGRDHLPGYAEVDDSSDNESLASNVRDYFLPPVDRRIDPLRSGGLSKEFWMKDENAAECFSCSRVFTAWRRKHHCRICGQIFCSRCTTLIPGDKFNYQGKMRVCGPCLELVDQYNSSSSASSVVEHPIIVRPPSTPLPVAGSNLAESVIPKNVPPIEISFNDAPEPTPHMAIPTTRKGVSVEIPPSPTQGGSPRSFSSRGYLRPKRRTITGGNAPERISLIQNAADEDNNLTSSAKSNGAGGLTVADAETVLVSDGEIDLDVNSVSSDGSEDERVMNLFDSLNPEASDLARSDSQSRSSFRRPRSGTNRSNNDQPKSSIMRIGQRNTSFSVTKKKRNGVVASTTPVSSPNKQIAPIIGTLSNNLCQSNSTTTTSFDLNKASINHAQLFLKQLLDDYNISLLEKWVNALMPPLLLCSENIDLDIKGGDSIDIRHYVKLKRIPGGFPRDTSYIDGIVFSKSLPLKSMPREIQDPRILVITFPVEYTRTDKHFMSLDPILAQEREYIKKLVKRIIALKPSILLAENTVCGLALQLLDRSGISVITNVKESVLNRIARYTQADILPSIDKLSLSPRLGKCALFQVRTFRFGNNAKTFFFLSGIPKQLGCTIVIRGSDAETLALVKAVIEFMVYVVFNLKLETSLMRDQFALFPSTFFSSTTSIPSNLVDQHKDDTGYFHDLVRDQANRILSSSPYVEFGYPYLLQEARELEDQLVARAGDENSKAIDGLQPDADQILENADDEVDKDMEEDSETDKKSTHSDITEDKVVDLAAKHSNQHSDVLSFLDLSSAPHGLSGLPGGDETIHKMTTVIKQNSYQILHQSWSRQKHQWELLYSQSPYMFHPSTHQGIFILYSLVCTITTSPCVGPEQLGIDFYSETDMTLGQFVELECASANELCQDGCGRLLRDHYKSYVNGSGRLTVSVEEFQSRIPGLQDTILMWSYCKICKATMPVLPMSDSTWKYSFGKYLELSFYSRPVSLRAGACSHDIYRDHVRYFGFHNLAVRFQYDSVELFEISTPTPRLSWNPEHEIQHKIDYYYSIKGKITKFWESVLSRLQSVKVEGVSGDKVEECRGQVESLVRRCEAEKSSTIEALDQIYVSCKSTELLPLNGVIRHVQDLVVDWDQEFAEFEHNFFPSEKDITRITTQQLKKIFIDRNESEIKAETESEILSEKSADKNEEIIEKTDDLEIQIAPALEVTKSNNGIQEKSETGTPVQSPTNVEGLKPMSNLDTPVKSGSQAADSSDAESPNDSLSRHWDPQATSPRKENMGAHVLEVVNKLEAMMGDQNEAAILTRENRHERKVSQQSQTSQNSFSDTVEPSTSTKNSVSLPQEENGKPKAVAASRPRPSGIPVLKMQNSDKSGSSLSSSPTRNELGIGSSKKISGNFRKLLSEKKTSLPTSGFRRFGGSTQELEKQLLRRSSQYNVSASSLAKHFDQLSREFEEERARERRLLAAGRFRALPVASSKPIVEVYKNVEDAVEELSDDEDERRKNSNSGIHTPAVQEDTSRAGREEAPVETLVAGSGEIHDDSHETATDTSGLEIPGTSASSITADVMADFQQTAAEKQSLMQALTNFWAERSATGWNPLAYPLSHSEHIFVDSDVIVREDEPSSLIAFCLSSADYLEKLKAMRHNETSATNENDGPHVNFDREGSSDLERQMLKKTGTHLRYRKFLLLQLCYHIQLTNPEFQEGSVRLACKIFYSEQFDAFRRQCGADENYIQSLSRCVKWDSSGGKSRSAFLKTIDDRLVVKELSPSELDAFVKFAPSYFEYMSQAFFHELPTVLAKIFGFYHIQIRNPLTGKTVRMDVLVMENLFYNKKMSRIFDLKGSMRNRHVQQTGRENEVLLDENMVEYIYESPLFVREHSKKLLRASLWNDTLFLAKMNVMDYSLVIGIDAERNELVVGIIDFVRTFTWDKKLESILKERGLVGGGVKEPTVVSPRQYKNRFREAMERYILMVPE